jgi:peptide/nickel transport system ATP-binding protein
MNAHHLLDIRNLSVEFRSGGGTVHAVRDVSLHVDRGETLVVMGESGSGKSVSASAVMDILDSPPGFVTSGEVLFEGQDLLRLPTDERRRINGEKIAMIFQDPLAYLNPVYNVGWQIAETLRAHQGMGLKAGREQAIRLLARVGIPDPERRVDHYPHQFSGGQRQRVMIAMAIANAPQLLIADEPTTALDVTVQAQILELLRDLLRETGMGLLMITHDLGVVADIADRAVVMKDGRIVESGPVREVFRAPKHPYTQKLLAAIPGRSGLPPHRQPVDAPPLIEVRDLVKHYPPAGGLFGRHDGEPVKAVDGVSLDLRRGETLGIVGESGSGKSTLGRMILRLEEPTSGRGIFDGKDLFALPAAELLRFRRRVQVVFQDPFASLNPRMTVYDIVSEPWTVHKDVVPRPRWRSRVTELLEQVGLKPEHAQRWPHQFSGGQRQRIAIARALALQPEIIVCDEAVSALDVSIQAQIIALLAELRDTLGLSYLFITHDLALLREFADRIVVMRRGKIVEAGNCARIFDRPQHPYTQTLLAASPVPDPDEQAERRRRRLVREQSLPAAE